MFLQRLWWFIEDVLAVVIISAVFIAAGCYRFLREE
jgi:hypothetical protein